jgi:ribosomal protein S18 acetylase RimI-like enzyme
LQRDLAGSGVSIRAESVADLPFSAALFASTREAELAQVAWPDTTKRAFCQQQFEAQHAHYAAHFPDAVFAIIERNGVAVGRVYIDEMPPEATLLEITIAAGERNGGIGGALLRILMQRADERGVPVGLHVEPFNPARRLYERHGFALVEAGEVYLYLRRAVPTPRAVDTATR